LTGKGAAVASKTRAGECPTGGKTPSAPPPGVTLLTVPEVAYEIRVSVDTVYRHIRSGLLGATKIGGKRFVSRASLKEMLDGNTTHMKPMAAGQKVSASVGLKESGMWNGKDY
jgi:excisionase family DNA binding protein